MPHAKNGRKINTGDKVISVDAYGNLTAGTVVSITEGAETCNLQIVPPGTPLQYATAAQCVHADDLADFKAPE